MKITKSIFILLLISSFSYGQKNNKSKKSVSSQFEIDRLYTKYKDKPSLEISFPNGLIECVVETILNDDDKPVEVQFSGEELDLEILSQFLAYSIKQKIANGFKEKGEYYINSEWSDESIENNLKRSSEGIKFVFLKGKEYTIIQARITDKKGKFAYSESDSKYYKFSITTGDMRRKGNGNSTTFDF
jgi:hypothetical protein